MHHRIYPVKAGVLRKGRIVDLPELKLALTRDGIPNDPQLWAHGLEVVGTVTVGWDTLPHESWILRARNIVENFTRTIASDISTAVPINPPTFYPPRAGGPAP